MVDTLHPPPAVVSSWPSPNYTDPETRGPALFYICILLAAIAIVFVSARLYGRQVLTRTPGWDDAFIVVALCSALGLSVLVVIGNRHCLSGRHIWDIPPDKLPSLRLNAWLSQWCYIISTSASKISVLLFYRRISLTYTRAFTIATGIGVVYNVCYTIAFCIALLSLCTPISAYWNSLSDEWVDKHPHYHCGAENTEFPLSGLFSVIGDLYSALPPMLVVLNLNLPPREKFSLYALFSTALLVLGAGIGRTVVLWKLMNTDYDYTWLLWEMWIWAMLEIYIVIIAASLPALKPLFRKPASVRNSTIMQGDSSYWPGAGSTSSTHRLGRKLSYSERSVRMNSKRLSLRESALIDEPDDIGLAVGGRPSFVIPEDRFDRELINESVGTRHFELRPSSTGRMVPTQVWKPASRDSLTSGTNRLSGPSGSSDWTGSAPPPPPPPPPLPSTPQESRHIRNFSHVWRQEDVAAVAAAVAVTDAARDAGRQPVPFTRRRSDISLPSSRRQQQPRRHRPTFSTPGDFTGSCPNINVISPSRPLRTPGGRVHSRPRTQESSGDSTIASMSRLTATTSLDGLNYRPV